MKLSAKMSTIYTDTCLKMLVTFQQNRAPAHHAHETIRLWEWDIQFHSAWPDLWPPNNHDLNPVNYMVCGVTQQQVYHSRVNTADELKECLIVLWSDFEQDILQLTSGESISKHTCVSMQVDILNIFCEQTLANNLQFFHASLVQMAFVHHVRFLLCWCLVVNMTILLNWKNLSV